MMTWSTIPPRHLLNSEISCEPTLGPEHLAEPDGAAPAFPQLLSQKQLCQWLGKSKSWAERARLTGDGPPYVKIGRTPRYELKAVLEWLSANRRSSTSE